MSIPDPRDERISALEKSVDSERKFSTLKEKENDRLKFDQDKMRVELHRVTSDHELWKRKLREAQKEIEVNSLDVERMSDIINECSIHEGHGWWFEAMVIMYNQGAQDARKMIDEKRKDRF